MNFRELAEDLGLEEDEFLELLELFIETSMSDLNKLQFAIKEENAEGTVSAAHSLRGAAGNLGLTEFREAVREIEEKVINDRLEGIAGTVQVLEKKLGLIAEAVTRSG